MRDRTNLFLLFIFATAVVSSACNEKDGSGASTGSSSGGGSNNAPAPSPTAVPVTTSPMLSAIWANEGGDKVSRDELRVAKNGKNSVINSIWDGSKVTVFGAKNEVVGFNLVLESSGQSTSELTIQFSELNGPGNFKIQSTPTTGNGVFTFTNRNIELFLTRYLQIKGLSRLSYETYDERHVPKRFQRPYSGAGSGSGSWSNRPDHDKYYPDIMVPLETVANKVSVAANQNQSVWVDVYIPKSAPAGIYTGSITMRSGTTLAHEVPVQLEVKTFTLPDSPTAKTMLYLGYGDVAKRYTGTNSPATGSANEILVKKVRDRHFQIAHRHKISMIDGDPGQSASPGDRPRDEWLSRLNGTLFNSANGYDGPGVGTGNGVYAVGAYGSWGWKAQGEAGMRTHTDAWVNWFNANSPSTEYFLYLIDESTDYAQTETWAQWVKNNPGVGKAMKSFATINLADAVSSVPSLSIAASWFTVGITSAWQNAFNTLKAASKKVFMYNGKRPANGSFATDDDGVALRELAWAQYKKQIDRWFFWESTYYNDYQGGRGETNVFQTAASFSGPTSTDASLGETGWNHSNGDGLLFFPGTDKVYPGESYNLEGPLASLRLKLWRRGIQDVDYIALAASVDAATTQAIVNQMVPKAFWEYGVTDSSDPTWVRTDISWSINPEDWENARKNLSNIIEGKPLAVPITKLWKGNPGNPLFFEAKQSVLSSIKKVAHMIPLRRR